jgi:dTDP-4-amino-4,6-dideoxygalactose transaminase
LDNPSGKKLPNSEQASDCSILLPLYPGLTPQEQEVIVRSLEIAALARV